MATLSEILQSVGFKGQGLAIALAIVQAESGGNTNAHNGNAATGDNSYGLFQINMLGAMGTERLQQYHLSSNNDLYNAQVNAEVAYKLSKGGTDWSPWSTYKSGAYLKYMNGGNGSTTVTTGGGGVTTPTTTAKLDPKTLASLYGLSYSLINSNTELKNLFSQAVKADWTPDVFTAHLKNTRWWATQSDTTRQYVTLRYTDPSAFKQKWDQTAQHLNSLAVQVGLGNLLGAGTNETTMNGFLKAAVYHVLKDGWSDTQVQQWFGAGVKFSGTEMSGQAGVDYDKLHTYAYANGISMSSAWYLNSVRAIEGGKSTVDTVLGTMRQQAASKYSAYASQIMAGQNALDLAAPYAKAVSDLLATE